MATLQSALKHHELSSLLVERGVGQARKAKKQRPGALARTVISNQVAQVRMSQVAVGLMLAEQSIKEPAQASLNLAAFTSDPSIVAAMVAATTDAEFDRLIASLIQDAGRAAEQVAVAVRPRTGWVRQLSPPSCSRCAVLAGRVYRYSDGFMRHPHDNCVTVPTRDGDTTHVPDVHDLARRGQVSGLSQADMKALSQGADLGSLVNVQRSQAGLSVAGSLIARRGRLTPAGIYRLASDRSQALGLLEQNGYIRT